MCVCLFFSFAPPSAVIYTLSLHDALPICSRLVAGEHAVAQHVGRDRAHVVRGDEVASGQPGMRARATRSEEHTSELQSRENLVCRLLLEKKKIKILIPIET